MRETISFTDSEAWNGGTVDALMYFGQSKVNDAITIFNALWKNNNLRGPYRSNRIEPQKQTPIIKPDYTDDGCEHLYGIYTHIDGKKMNFVQKVVFDEYGLWVYAGVTVGSLPSEWNVGAYPDNIDEGIHVWEECLLEELRTICHSLYKAKPIKAAIYGWLTVSEIDTLLEAVDGSIPDHQGYPIDIWIDGVNHFYPASISSGS